MGREQYKGDYTRRNFLDLLKCLGEAYLSGRVLAACTPQPDRGETAVVPPPTPSKPLPATPTLENEPTLVPTLAKSYEPKRMALIETGAAALEPADNPPFYNEWGENSPITGWTETDLELARAEQWLRIFTNSIKSEDQPKRWPSEAAYLADMNLLAIDNPQLTVVQVQSPDQASLLTYMVHSKESGSSVFWGFKDGAVAFTEPDRYDRQTIMDEVPLPAGTRPMFRYNQLDKHWYLFAMDSTDQPVAWFNTSGAIQDNLEQQWMKLLSRDFSEKYPPVFTEAVEYTDSEHELTIPMAIAIDETLPINEVHATSEMAKWLEKMWLYGNYVQYVWLPQDDELIERGLDPTVIRKLSFEDYVENYLKAGKGQVAWGYYDDKTGDKREGLIDARSGFSVQLSFRNDLPLKEDDRMTFYQTGNSLGKVIIIMEVDKKIFEENLLMIRKYGRSDKELYEPYFTGSFLNAIQFWGSISRACAMRDGCFRSGIHNIFVDYREKSGLIDALDNSAQQNQPMLTVVEK